MKALVIGGTGFIGAHVVRALVERGCDVTIYHTGAHEPPLPEGVHHIHHPAARVPVLSFPGPADVVVHMIAMGEADAAAAARYFADRTQRLVVLSSGDVYLAYGRLIRLEPGEPEPMPLDENAPLRNVRFPYRAQAKSESDLEFWYDKIVVEERVREIGGVVLRLPKVYGPGGRDNFVGTHMARNHPSWRWTHGYVENVAHAIALAATWPRALPSNVYNIGEAETPTVGERRSRIPARDVPTLDYDFRQDLVMDSSRIRRELGFAEIVDYDSGLQRTR